VTDVDGEEDESKSVRFDVAGGDEFRDYTIDLSTQPQWEGMITGLRLDPVDLGERTIDIDAIVFGRT
jgi:hypothetical protein